MAGAGAPPQRPAFSSTSAAHFTFASLRPDGTRATGTVFEYSDPAHGRYAEDEDEEVFTGGGSGRGEKVYKMKRLRFDLGYRYEVINRRECSVRPYAGGATLLPFWSFLEAAEPAGSSQWNGVPCTIWAGVDPVTNESKAVCHSTSEGLSHSPLLYWRNKSNGIVLSRVYQTFEPSIPSRHVFDVPAECGPVFVQAPGAEGAGCAEASAVAWLWYAVVCAGAVVVLVAAAAAIVALLVVRCCGRPGMAEQCVGLLQAGRFTELNDREATLQDKGGATVGRSVSSHYT